MVSAEDVTIVHEDGDRKFVPIVASVFHSLYRLEGMQTECF